MGLSCGADVSLNGKMRQTGFDMLATQDFRVAVTVEDDEASYPPDILLFRAVAAMANTQRLPHPIEEALFS